MIPLHTPDLLTDLCQLVLFPEVLDVTSVPLAICQRAESAPGLEHEEGALTYRQAVEMGQLSLFT